MEAGVASTLLLRLGGKPVASAVVYLADLGSVKLGVMYYVAVEKRWRGKGLGKVLVLSAEEAMGLRGASGYVATTTIDNRASMSLFSSLGYAVLSWDAIGRRYGWRAVENLVRATCGYEDDVAMVKPVGMKLGRLLELISAASKRRVSRLWSRICYRPWLALWRGSS